MLDIHKCSLLFVDDQQEHLEVYSLLFEKWGYLVTTLRRGADVLEAILNNHFDILVIDIQLPNVSGVDVIKQIRSDRRFDNLPIVALTASQSDLEDEILAVGATGFCLKSDVAVKLQEKMSKALSTTQVRTKG